MTSTPYLSGIPSDLRQELLDALNEILRNFREQRWEPSELNGGKLCEVVYTILRGYIDGVFPSKASKPGNMLDACKALERVDQARFSRSIRVQIPRVLIALYEVRNNRGVGHVGGDVSPNKMDAHFVVNSAKWVVAELIRVFHGVSTSEAESAVDKLVERVVPIVWDSGAARRVLDHNLPQKDQTLLLLYSANQQVGDNELCSWVEAANRSAYKRTVLGGLHRTRLVEYANGKVTLSPSGIAYVENNLKLQI